jgi:hypothetical protein
MPKNKEKKISAKEIQTSNVSKEIKKYSIETTLHPAKIDFDIINVTTEYCEIVDGNEQIQDWHILDSTSSPKVKNKDFLLNEDIRFRQKYELRMKPKEEDEDFHLEMSFGENKSMTKLAILIKKESKLKMSRDLADRIIKEIEKEKLKHGYFIRIWNDGLDQQVSTMVINFSEYGKLSKDYQINIGSCENGAKPVNDLINYHYKNKKGIKPNASFIGVKEQELIIEYIKPKAGEAGRNCKGEYIEAKEAVVKHQPTFNIGDGVEMVEDDDSIKYYAKKNGVVMFKDNLYDVVNDISFAMLDFRKTGSIKAGLDSGVKLTIEEKDPMKDAIGSGVSIEVTELNINGNLGRDTDIKAKKVKVEGQVHTSAQIWADESEIGRHKGLVEGGKVRIERLESGKVIADDVRIVDAMGGDIRAKRVNINNLHSHCTIHAVESIVINQIVGDNNKLIITGAGDVKVYKKYQRIKNSLEEFEQQMRYTGQTIDDYKDKINEDKAKGNEIKSRLLEYKEKNIKPPTALMNDFARIKEVILKNKELEKKIKNRENALHSLISADETMYSAEVLVNKGWQGHSSVIFYYLSEDEGMEIRPRDGTMKIYLKKATEGDPDSFDQIIED